jgi:hypothetical protein
MHIYTYMYIYIYIYVYTYIPCDYFMDAEERYVYLNFSLNLSTLLSIIVDDRMLTYVNICLHVYISIHMYMNIY